MSAHTVGLESRTTRESVIVESENGKLRGFRGEAAVSFKGIPYAAPTGGVNRFMAPQPVANWGGVRDTLRLGDRCMQQRTAHGDTRVLSWYAQTEPLSEDCCVLNVFTPGINATRRPVMVYVHGGGYVTGGGGGAVLDGSHLAQFGDVVVVTLNHRLNVFGYLNLGHLDSERFGDAANAGQLDLIAALKWINRNIAAFGGDPANVTMFGQSGGGSKITVLMGMPEAKGFFHRAISMSGSSGTTVAAAQETEAYVGEFLRVLRIDKNTLHKLQDIPAATLLEARQAAVTAKREGSRPVVDGRHVFGGPMTVQCLPHHASVPMLMGTTATEGSFFLANDIRHMTLTERQVMERLKAQFVLDDVAAHALMQAFRRDDPARTPSEILLAIMGEGLVRAQMLEAAGIKASAGQAPVYLYNFTWKAPVDGGIWGAPHTIDIPFAFGNTDRATSLLGSASEPAEVAHHLMSAFVAFARSGNPNNPDMPEWTPFDPIKRTAMLIDRMCGEVNDYLPNDRITGSGLRLDRYNCAALMTYRD